MKRLPFFIFLGFICHVTFLYAQTGPAQEPVQAPKPKANLQMFYPELTVSPSASERLELEYKKEKKGDSVSHLPLYSSAVTTLITGYYVGTLNLENPSAEQTETLKNASTAGMIVGAGWLATGIWLQAKYRPYEDGLRAIVPLPKQTQADQLARERLAEEAIFNSESLARKIKWMSFSTNLVASLAMASVGHKKAAAAGGIAALVSAAPLIFPYSWETTGEFQREYKKKIYGPIGQFRLFETKGEVSPGFQIGWNF